MVWPLPSPKAFACRLSLFVPVIFLFACGGGAEADANLVCPPHLELFEGACVEGRTRYEPHTRLDQDNVVDYGAKLSEILLPEPPKSGFRIVAPPVEIEPGQEIDTCVSWSIPDLHNNVVYSARLYTTPGLHHSNVTARPIDPELGPQPYPGCIHGATDPFATISEGIPDVIFASSTQIVGNEDIVFPPGKGYRLDTTREITTSIHYINTTNDVLRAEVAYDVYTMPDADLVDEVAPWVLSNYDFAVPPQSSARVQADCPVFGGDVLMMMPHTHQFIDVFSADALAPDQAPRRILEQHGYDLKSNIQSFNPPVSLEGVDHLRFTCDYVNTSDRTLHYGIGDNEMCILFGYIYPVKYQFVGYVENAEKPCVGLQLGLLH